MEATAVITRAGRREWTGLAVLTLPTLLLALDFSVLFLALPRLSAELEPSSTQLLWITDIYGFMVAGFLVTMGTLGDRVGRRKLLMIGASVFAAVSVLAAYSVSAEMLIVARALLGVAGATVMPSTLALISNMFRNPGQRATAISLWVTSLLSGVAIGPIIGGALLDSFWWGSVFLLGVPVMVLLLVTAPFLLPEYRDAQAGRLDLTSVVLSLTAVLAVVYGFKEIAKGGLASQPVMAIALGLVVGVAFVGRQRTLDSPLLDLGLFKDRAIVTALVTLAVGTGAVIGVGFVFAQYLQLVLGLSPFAAGLWSIPDAAGVIAGSLLAPAVARRIRPAGAIGVGLAISAGGFLLLTQVQPASLALAVIGVTIVAFGIAPTLVLGTDLVVGSAPPQRAGSAAALSETSSELGIALGIATLGSIGTAVYRHAVAARIPAGVPPEADAVARDTIVGAVAAAAQVPGQLGGGLLEAARAAYVTSFGTVAAVCAPVVVGLGVLAAVLLRHVGSSDEDLEATGATAEPTGPHPAAPVWPTRPPDATDPVSDGCWVLGQYCSRRHFNDPNVPYCCVCGISMLQVDSAPTLGERPALGLLVLDDGTVYPLARSHVVGRAPEIDQAVTAGEAGFVRLPDPLVSKVHAWVELDGWEVSLRDARSTNGTFVCAPGQKFWSPLPPGGRTALVPGTFMAFGQHTMRYHSHRAG